MMGPLIESSSAWVSPGRTPEPTSSPCGTSLTNLPTPAELAVPCPLTPHKPPTILAEQVASPPTTLPAGQLRRRASTSRPRTSAPQPPQLLEMAITSTESTATERHLQPA